MFYKYPCSLDIKSLATSTAAAKHKMRDRATDGRRKPHQWQKVKADILRFPKWYDT